MTQKYDPVEWEDETPTQPGTLINKARLDQMQSAHHFADGFEEVDAIPTADPGTDYHKVVYCTADSTFYRWDGTQWTADIDDDTKRLLEEHEADHSNPHAVTKAQVGLGNVDNTSDEDKPVSTAQATAIGLVESYLDTHEGNHSNPHQVTAAQVGLGNVDNTSDVNKPVSTAQQAAISGVQANLTTHTSDHNNPHSVTKAQVGLGNVDNTSDLDKPISTATQDALDGLESDYINRINSEVTDRGNADTGIRNDLHAETVAREDADVLLNARADSLQGQVDERVRIANGVTEWSSAVTYTANAFCARNGTLYRSLSANNGNHDPLSSTGWWEEYASGSKQSTGLIGPDNVYTEDIGDGSATVIAVNHGLTSYDVLWCLWSNSDRGVASVQAVKTSVDVLTLTFAVAPAADEYRVLVFRPGDAARIYTQTFAPSGNDVVITHNLGRLPAGISLYAPDGTRIGVRMTVDTTTITLHFAGYETGNYTIQVVA